MPIADVAAELFYDRLFEIAPQVRPLFRRDMKNQGRKLMTTLAMVVGGLKNLEAMMPAIAGLAVKHVNYGVTAEHYEPVGEALIWTLERGLGPAFTPQTREAWMTAYGALSAAMIEAAYGQRAAA
jgi:hemoglobin-like flavoprotein